MWCVAELDDEYIAKMKDVLALYEKPYRSAEPVFAWMKSRFRCTPMFAHAAPHGPVTLPSATTNTSVGEPLTSSRS
jgi:hypothetical protein